MKTRTKRIVKKASIWLMTLILALNYCVNMALAAEGIGEEAFPDETAPVTEAVTVQVAINPAALVDAAIFQAGSSTMPVDGSLPVGMITVDEIPVAAFVTLSADFDTFAEKCAGLSGQFDPEMAFDSGYTSALQQGGETAALWQEIAAMIADVAVINASDRLVNLEVVPVQADDGVALAPGDAVLIEGEPLEVETAAPQAPEQDEQDESGSGESSQPEREPQEEASQPEDTESGGDSESSSSESSDVETPPQDTVPDGEQAPGGEDANGEALPDGEQDADIPASPDSQPGEESGGVMGESEDSSGQNEDETGEPDGGSDVSDASGETDEPVAEESSGEGDMEANAGRAGHVIFYETSADDELFSVGEPTEDAGALQEMERQEAPDANPDDAAGEKPQEPAEEPSGESGVDNEDAVVDDGGEDDSTVPVELPKETIAQKESSVEVLNARPLGGVKMAFQASTFMAENFTGSEITITGPLTSSQGDGLNAAFFWVIKDPKYNPKEAGRTEYVPLTSDYPLVKKFDVAGWEKPDPIECGNEADSVTISLVYNTGKLTQSYTFYLIQIPPSGYAPHTEPIGTLTVSGSGKSFVPGSALSGSKGKYTISYDGQGFDYKQYTSTNGTLKNEMRVEGQEVYCFNEPYRRPTQADLSVTKAVRYLKTAPNKSADINEKVKRTIQYGYSGNYLNLRGSIPDSKLYNDTQWVVWRYTDYGGNSNGLTDVGKNIYNAVEAGPPTESTASHEASVSFQNQDGTEISNITLNFNAATSAYVSAPIFVRGNFDNCTFDLPDGVKLHVGAPDGNATTVILDETEIYLVSASQKDSITVTAKAVTTWSDKVGEISFYEPVSQFMTEHASEVRASSKYQSLIGYSPDAQTDSATQSLTASTSEDPTVTTASLTLHKVDAQPDETGAQLPLSGAHFALEQYGNNDWAVVNPELVTGQDGKITIANLALDTPYRLTETTAPEGYNPLASSIQFMLSKDAGGAIAVYQIAADASGAPVRGEPWVMDGQNISVSGLTMTVPNVKAEEPIRSLKLHLDHLVQSGYDAVYNDTVKNASFRFALVKDGQVYATGVSNGGKNDVVWTTPRTVDAGSGDTVSIGEGAYYMFGFNVEQPFERVEHDYLEVKKADGSPFPTNFAGTDPASGTELKDAADLLNGAMPFMGVKIVVTDQDLTNYNGGTIYYHAESRLQVGDLTLEKIYYDNQTYRSADDAFTFEIRKMDNATQAFEDGHVYTTVQVKAGDGKATVKLPYGFYAVRETGMPDKYTFHAFSNGAGAVFDATGNVARFAFPRSLMGSAANPASQWNVTVTAQNSVSQDPGSNPNPNPAPNPGGNDNRDDDDDNSYRSDGAVENNNRGGGGGDVGRNLFNHDDLVNIPDEAIPLSDKPLAEIPDEDVPLGALPNTGGFSMGIFAAVGAAFAAIGVFLRRGKKSKA